MSLADDGDGKSELSQPVILFGIRAASHLAVVREPRVGAFDRHRRPTGAWSRSARDVSYGSSKKSR